MIIYLVDAFVLDVRVSCWAVLVAVETAVQVWQRNTEPRTGVCRTMCGGRQAVLFLHCVISRSLGPRGSCIPAHRCVLSCSCMHVCMSVNLNYVLLSCFNNQFCLCLNYALVIWTNQNRGSHGVAAPVQCCHCPRTHHFTRRGCMCANISISPRLSCSCMYFVFSYAYSYLYFTQPVHTSMSPSLHPLTLLAWVQILTFVRRMGSISQPVERRCACCALISSIASRLNADASVIPSEFPQIITVCLKWIFVVWSIDRIIDWLIEVTCVFCASSGATWIHVLL